MLPLSFYCRRVVGNFKTIGNSSKLQRKKWLATIVEPSILRDQAAAI